ncbi:glycosyltransferase family 4 protein [Aquiflexum sp. LQ15W]|uniref:glycosyltransferase family 4 protein n=1 Tax=Cognataquiflexum nitidum TaxID=2922272 RepID=UPI001F13C61B|nr:glycosyltransferase family 4 protein [Cognataquiflexum nitidum]MCH6199263.1 glycosyltransferase family 4 protein [Cognataquiflexum nitidum]
MEYVFICGNLYPFQVGGMEVFNHYLIRELKKTQNLKIISHQNRPDFFSKDEFARVKTFFPHGLFFSIFIFFKFLIKKSPNQRVVVSFSKAHWINWLPYILLKKIVNLKYIVIIHSGDLGSWGNIPIQNQLMQNSYKVFGVSNEICDYYVRLTGSNIYYLPPLIPFEDVKLDKFESREFLNLPVENKIILIVGSLKPLKNPETIIQSFELLGKDFIKKECLNVVVVGDGEMNGKLRLMVKKIDMEENFFFAGIQPRELIPYYYQSADLFLISSEYEGRPLALLEALKYPLEIIGSDADGVKSILERFDGNIFTKNDPESLAKLLKKIFTDPDYSPKFKEANKYFKENFDYKVFLNEFLKLTE